VPVDDDSEETDDEDADFLYENPALVDAGAAGTSRSAQPAPARRVLVDLTNVPLVDATVNVKGKANSAPPPPMSKYSTNQEREEWTLVAGWCTTDDDEVLIDKGKGIYRSKWKSNSRSPKSVPYY
jgi:hypothetical protein